MNVSHWQVRTHKVYATGRAVNDLGKRIISANRWKVRMHEIYVSRNLYRKREAYASRKEGVLQVLYNCELEKLSWRCSNASRNISRT